MKTALILFASLVLYTNGIAQENSQEEVKRIIKKVQENLDHQYESPRREYNYNLSISFADYWLSVGEYKKAYSNYGLALRYIPGDPYAKEQRRYCKRMMR